MKKNTKFNILLLFISIITVVFAILPEFGRMYIPTHDGEYHIIRIVEFARMLSQGNMVPRWAPTLNSGYGVPVFQFNYPLPNYIGSFLRLFTHDAVYAYQWAIGFGYLFVAVALFLWLESVFGIYPAIIGAMVGAFTPYLFVDTFIRGSIGEVWAIGFLCLTLFGIEKNKFTLTALSFACIIVSHNILALVFTPFLLIYTWIVNKKSYWPLAAGIGLASFFWLPALAEQKFVQGLNTVNFREHFVEFYELIVPSWGSAFSGSGMVGNTLSFQIGLAPIVALILALFSFKGIKNKKITASLSFLLFVFAVCIFLMMRVSESIWRAIPLMQNIQYPWRLLSFVIPVVGFCAALWVSRLKRAWLGVLLAAFAVIVTISYARPVLYQPRNEAYYLARSNFTDGTSSMGNAFSTIWTGWKSARPPSSVAIQNGRLVKQIKDAYLNKQFTVSMSKPGAVTENILYFPGWMVLVDNKVTQISYKTDGIISFNVPAGNHSITVQFGETPIRRFSDVVSLLSLGLVIAWGILHLYEHRN